MNGEFLSLSLVGWRVIFFIIIQTFISNIIYLFLKIIFCSVYNLAMGVILGDIKLMKYVKTAQMGGFLKTSIV